MNRPPQPAVIAQLETEATLRARLAASPDRVAVYERLAMGGGSTNWFLAEPRDVVSSVAPLLRPGSIVTFYFGGQVQIRPVSPQLRADLVAHLLALPRGEHEVVAGTVWRQGPSRSQPHLIDGISVDMQLCTTSAEIDELFAGLVLGEELVCGYWPEVAPIDAYRVTLVDADGVVRGHPH